MNKSNVESSQAESSPAQLSQAEVKSGPLGEEASRRIEDFLLEAQSGGEDLKVADGQSVVVVFDLNESPGTRTRTINTKDGEKEITRFAFVVWNPVLKQRQFLELANRWVRAALEAMVEYNTNSLVVKRTGTTITDTSYFHRA